MGTVSITPLGHAAVLLEQAGKSLVIDPGHFSDPSALTVSNTVLITHDHFDHVDPAALAARVNDDTSVEVWAPSRSRDLILEAGAEAGRVHLVAPGDSFVAGGFDVTVIGGDHAQMFADMPCSQNVGYIVDHDIVHPGDSFAELPAGATARILLLPVAAPWLTVNDVVAYARYIAPEVAIPIHDAILSDAGKSVFDRIVGSAPGMPAYTRIPQGEKVSV